MRQVALVVVGFRQLFAVRRCYSCVLKGSALLERTLVVLLNVKELELQHIAFVIQGIQLHAPVSEFLQSAAPNPVEARVHVLHYRFEVGAFRARIHVPVFNQLPELREK